MIYLGADHRGMELKAKISTWLAGRSYKFEDVGAYEYNHDDDYVDHAILVGQKIGRSDNRGIVICGSGVGVDIAANKVPGVRCGLGFAKDQVHAARKDDNINVLALAADNIESNKAIELIETFLETSFDASDKYVRRMEKIGRYELA